MDTVTQAAVDFAKGDPIVLVSYRDEWARLYHGTVACLAPFSVIVGSDESNILAANSNAMLLTCSEHNPYKAQVQVSSAHTVAEGIRLEFESFDWEKVDRRKYPRIPMKLPVELQLVEETESGPKISTRHAFTEDMSLGGAWVQMDNPLPKDALVEFRTWPSTGSFVRSLAVVMHSSIERQGIGLEFVTFIGPSKLALEEFLNAA